MAKIEIFQIHIEYSSTTIWVKNEGKQNQPAEPAEPAEPQNRSISYGFRDINIFGLSAKIQDGRQKWRKN